jgi:8-oxo-dGTP pyrophosphatase MutT (NUDIX family)
MSEPPRPFLVDSETIYDSIIGLRQDTVTFPDGITARRHVVTYRPACAAVVLDMDEEAVLLVRHYRHPVRKHLWEIPGGIIEDDETPEECAVREVTEETGVVAREPRRLLTFHPEPAFADHAITLVQASADRPAAAKNPPDDPEIATMEWFDRGTALSMIRRGEIASSWSIIGLLMTLKTS